MKVEVRALLYLSWYYRPLVLSPLVLSSPGVILPWCYPPLSISPNLYYILSMFCIFSSGHDCFAFVSFQYGWQDKLFPNYYFLTMMDILTWLPFTIWWMCLYVKLIKFEVCTLIVMTLCFYLLAFVVVVVVVDLLCYYLLFPISQIQDKPPPVKNKNICHFIVMSCIWRNLTLSLASLWFAMQQSAAICFSTYFIFKVWSAKD